MFPDGGLTLLVKNRINKSLELGNAILTPYEEQYVHLTKLNELKTAIRLKNRNDITIKTTIPQDVLDLINVKDPVFPEPVPPVSGLFYRDEFNQFKGKLDVDLTDVKGALQKKADQAELEKVAALSADKATKADVERMGSASPKGVYANLSALEFAFPSGTTGIYVVQSDGKWYYWTSGKWTVGGVYQAPLADASNVNLTSNKVASTNVKLAIEEVKEKVSKNTRNLINADKPMVKSSQSKINIPYNAINKSIIDFIVDGGTDGGLKSVNGYTYAGKNLFNKSATVTGKYVDHLDGGEKTASTQTSSIFIAIPGNADVTFSSVNGIKFSRVVFYDKDKRFISGVNVSSSKRSITASSPTNAAFVRVSADINTSKPDTWQVEIGSKETEYAEYQPPVTVSFPKTINLRGIPADKDTFDSDGVLTVKLGQKLLSGSENWYEGTSTTNCYAFYMTGWATANNALTGTPNSGKASSVDGGFPVSSTDGSSRGINLLANGNLTLFIEKNKVDQSTGATNLERFKSYLAINQIDFVYKLVNPLSELLNIPAPIAYSGGSFEIIGDTDAKVSINIPLEKQVVPPNMIKHEDLQLEKAGIVHKGGFKYTSFGGGAMVNGKEVYVQRSAPKHTTVNGEYGNLIAYMKDKYGNWETKLLNLGITGGELRDVNLSLPYDGTSDVILSGTVYTGVSYQYTNWIFRLDKNLDLKSKEEMLGTEGLFAWGNVLFTPQGRTIKPAYDQNFGGSNRGVFLCRREAQTNNYSLIELFPASSVNPNEINIGYWGNKLVAICRQRADYSLYRETTDLEGLTGWSTPRKLNFKAHAPQIPCYTPKRNPLIITFSSVTDELVSQLERNHRDVSISATFNGIDWHPEKILVENNHYGGYTSMVPNGFNRYGMVYYDDYDAAKSNYKEGTDLFYKEIQLERVLTDLPVMQWRFSNSEL